MSSAAKREPMYRCRCCNWMSYRKVLCPQCAEGCVMRKGPVS